MWSYFDQYQIEKGPRKMFETCQGKAKLAKASVRYTQKVYGNLTPKQWLGVKETNH